MADDALDVLADDIVQGLQAFEFPRDDRPVSGDNPAKFLGRHVLGDWGDLAAGDKEANNRAVEDGTRILSAYDLRSGERIWIITEADRSSTRILLPSEY
jgi:hypothetical protein